MSEVMLGDSSEYIKVLDNAVEIKNSSSLFILKRQREIVTITYSQITGVAICKPGLITIGYIEIKFPGNDFNNSDREKKDVLKNPYAYFLKTGEYKKALKLKEIIEKRVQIANSARGTFSPADEIMKYKQLLDIGAITKQEYEKKKNELLSL